MDEDERRLLRAMQERTQYEPPRDTIARLGIPPERADTILQKWVRNGWYDYGDVLDMGWIETKGLSVDTSERETP